MMRCLLIWAALVCCEGLLAQETFNVRFDLYSEGTGDVGLGIENTEYGYIVFSNGKSPVFPHHVEVWAYGIDFEGNLLFSKAIGSDSLYYTAGWCNSSAPTTDGNFILGGHARKPGASHYEPHLIKFTPEGDTLWKSSFYSEMQYLGYAGCQAADGGYALTGITQDVDSPEIPWYNGYIMKVDSAGDFEWLKKYFMLGHSVWFLSVAPMPDNGFVAAGSLVELSGGSAPPTNLYCVRTNSDGEQIWSKSWGTLGRDFDAMVNVSSDGNILVTGSIHDESLPISTNRLHWYAAKLAAVDGQVIWEMNVEPSIYNSPPYKILETSMGEIIVVGNRRDNFPIDGEPWYEHRGSLWKLSAEGDSLWLRTYAFADGHPCHFRDVIETPDGGFAAVGVAEISPGYMSDDTWVVKVDQHGCLVPGCHLVNVEELEAKGGRMLVYPNPVRDVLNVYLESQDGRPGSFSLVDMNGRTVKQWRAGGEPTTYMADVSALAAGVYVLRFEGGGVALSEKVVIEN